MALALEGIRVVDVSQVAAVPMAARHLADFGADVVHVENPVAGDSLRAVQAGTGMAIGTRPESAFGYYWENYNRNKKSVAIDVSQGDGREILYKLVEKSDVFLTNMRPFELEKYRLQYSTLSELNPRLVYGSLTGYGKKGPERNAPGYDHTAYWPRSGFSHRVQIAARVGPEALPASFVPAFGDNVVALALAYGIMTALFAREKTGLGQEVDTSIFQTGVYHNSWDVCAALVTGQDPEVPPREDAPNPLAMLYRTKDNRWLVFCMPQSDRYWPRFCLAIDRPDLEKQPRFATFEARAENHCALFEMVEAAVREKTLNQWRPLFNEAGLSWGPYQNFPEIVADPQAVANDFFVSQDHPTHGRVRVVASPVNLGKTPATLRMGAPEFGQHTEEVLLDLGYTWEDIERFKEHRAIA